MNIGVLLSGNGVFDGAELQETVFVLAAIDRHGATAICMAPNINQHHVVNHVTGEEMNEVRNVMVEAARVARGAIQDVAAVSADNLHAIVLPGGFGTAKNLSSWAFRGPDSGVNEETAQLLRNLHAQNKPIVGLCMAPVVIAKAFEGTSVHPHLTIGTSTEPSPYDIAEIHAGIRAIGSHPHNVSVREITVDTSNRIITAPCYMMEARVSEVQDNVNQAIDALFTMLQL